MGILTVAVVTKPFEFEGNRRMGNAEAGLAELETCVDSLIVVLNEKLLEVLGDDVTQAEAFAQANDVLRNAVGGISEIIHDPGQVNVDFEDVRSVMSEPGKAMMGTALAGGPDRARIAAEQAIACPLLEGVDLSGAKGVLVLITASKDTLKMAESREAVNTVRAYAAADANLIYGMAYDNTMEDNIRVTVVATGLSRPNLRRQAASPPQFNVLPGGLRTGTDNVPVLDNVIGMNVASPAVPVRGAPEYNPMNSRQVGPRVWGNNRTMAGAKVQALSSSGMDDVEIPAFLRKQAD
jgi:cell division protein FtsZ